MKYVKILGLAAMALTALMAMVGTASADTLTSPTGTTYTGKIHATSTNATLTSAFGGFGSIACEHSTIVGTVTTHGPGVPVTGHINELTFTKCTGGEPTTPVSKPGTLTLHGKTGNTGELTSLGAEVIVHNTSLGTCTFSTSASGTSIGTVTGSSSDTGKAVLNIKGTIPATSGFCGQGTWEGSYTVLTPVPLIIDKT